MDVALLDTDILSELLKQHDPAINITSTELIHDLPLVTGNTKYFEWIAGLRLDNWRSL